MPARLVPRDSVQAGAVWSTLLLRVQVLLDAGIVQVGLGDDRLARAVVPLKVVVAVEVLDAQQEVGLLGLHGGLAQHVGRPLLLVLGRPPPREDGQRRVVRAAQQLAPVIDIMEALKASLAMGRKPVRSAYVAEESAEPRASEKPKRPRKSAAQ